MVVGDPDLLDRAIAGRPANDAARRAALRASALSQCAACAGASEAREAVAAEYRRRTSRSACTRAARPPRILHPAHLVPVASCTDPH